MIRRLAWSQSQPFATISAHISTGLAIQARDAAFSYCASDVTFGFSGPGTRCWQATWRRDAGTHTRLTQPSGHSVGCDGRPAVYLLALVVHRRARINDPERGCAKV